MIRNYNHCGKEFKAHYYNSKYCSNSCRVDIGRIKARAWSKKKAGVRNTSCIVCDADLTIKKQKYCSVACSDKAVTLKRLYGLTVKSWRKLVKHYGGICSICGKSNENLVIDHCHDTGRVRGMICSSCNLMLGHAYDQPDILRCGASYLEGENNYE